MNLLESCYDLIRNIATGAEGAHPDAAVMIQFNAGAWQRFCAAVAAEPAPLPADAPDPIPDPPPEDPPAE
jgi:hypothetical protein